MSMDTEVEDQMFHISQCYSGSYCTQEQAPPQEECGKRRRRRRRKSQDEANGCNGGGGGKRKLSQEQVNFLETNFANEHKLESERKERLALEVGLDPRQVAVWFQNRRARWRSKKLEEEYLRLKSEHETTVLDNYRLQTEVLRLKDQLTEAEKEMQKLMERFDINSSNSPISSLSMEAIGPQHFFDEFGMDGLENIFNMPENNYIHGMDWVDLYR